MIDHRCTIERRVTRYRVAVHVGTIGGKRVAAIHHYAWADAARTFSPLPEEKMPAIEGVARRVAPATGKAECAECGRVRGVDASGLCSGCARQRAELSEANARHEADRARLQKDMARAADAGVDDGLLGVLLQWFDGGQLSIDAAIGEVANLATD